MQRSLIASNKNQLGHGLGSGFIAFLVILGLSFTPALDRLENVVSDILRSKLAEPFVSPIEIVYLDDSSLKTAETQYGLPYPWPRESYATAINFFNRAGAKAVVFDFLFTSKSPNGKPDDLLLARAAKAHGKVFSGLQISSASQPDALKRLESQSDLYTLSLSPTSATLFEGHGVDAPYPPLWGGFTGIGDVYFKQDADSLNRRARLFSSLRGKIYPSLAFSAAWNLDGKPKISLTPYNLSLGSKIFSVEEGGTLNILFKKIIPRNQSVSLIDVITSENALSSGDKASLDPARFKNKIVLIGSDAPGLLDLRPHPLNKRGPGVELQAMVLDNLLSGQSLDVVPMGLGLWFALLILCLLIARFSFNFRGPAVLLPSALGMVAVITLSVWAYQSHTTLIPTATPLLAVLAALSLSAGENYRVAARQRNRVQNIFGQFLSPAVLSKLRLQGNELKTGGETKDLAVFFSDLAGFTSFSEKLSPEALVVILNTYLEEMAEVVVGRHDGYVDKYIGDAIMAIWGAPTPHANPALEAVQAAWHCQKRLAEIQPKLAELGLDAGEEGLVMRIGINYGPCVVGLMGSQRKLNYTVMGDTVNTASRLEGANKPYGTRIMLSESAAEACGDSILVRTLDFLKVKGKADATKVFELIGLKNEPGELYPQAHVAAYEEAMGDYRQGHFAQAMRLFESCMKAQPKDSVSKLYAVRCAEFIKNPPEGIWDGVYVMKTK
jgi:adenylate cyclase